jgi:hypothetical protein
VPTATAIAEDCGITLTGDAELCTKTWIYLGTSADALVLKASSTAGTCTLTYLEPGTTYYIRLSHAIGNRVIMSEEILTVKTLGQPIVAPTVTTTAGAGSITLQWNGENCTKTWIYLGTCAEDLQLLYACSGDSYTVTGLWGDTKYYIRLSHSISGKVVNSDTVLEVTTQAQPNLEVAAQLSGSDLVLDWNTEGDSSKYWITVVRDGKSWIYSTKETCYIVPDFDPATCTVSVRGINSTGTYDYAPVKL